MYRDERARESKRARAREKCVHGYAQTMYIHACIELSIDLKHDIFIHWEKGR